MNKTINHFGIRVLLAFAIVIGGVFPASSQEDYKTEDDLKKGAEKLFLDKNFVEAAPLFSQLVSLYPKDPNFNYKYGACLLDFSDDSKEPINYLEFAVSRQDVDPAAYYYLGLAYHQNYEFKKAQNFYGKFKVKAKGKALKELDADAKIKMCKSGLSLLRNITDLVVYEKSQSTHEDFFRAYNMEGYGGKLIVKPEDFKSEFEKKNNVNTVMFLPDDAKRLYFSMTDPKTTQALDIFYVDKTVEGEWGTPTKLEGVLNSEGDENYPFIHPNGTELYFSSTGHNSMGGYDIFRSFLNTETGQWSEPVNVDFAINTPKDDYFFIPNKDNDRAYFTSNRSMAGNKVNVYNIGMVRVPVQYSVIMGEFNAPSSKSAKITVENMYNNETVGSYETDAVGNYSIKLPSSGKFRFLVEQENSLLTHAGVVEMTDNGSFKPFKQKMEIVVEGDEEKLIITNLLDEEIGEDELPMSVELLVDQANLEVNYQEKEQLVAQAKPSENTELINNQEGETSQISDLTADQGNSSGSDNSSINSSAKIAEAEYAAMLSEPTKVADQAEKMSSFFEESSKILSKQSTLSNSISSSKQELADNESAQIEKLTLSDEEITPETQKELDALMAELDTHQEQANAAASLTEKYSALSSSYSNQSIKANELGAKATQAGQNNQSLTDVENADSFQSDFVEYVSQYKEEEKVSSAFAITKKVLSDYEDSKKVVEKKQAYADELERTLASEESALEDLYTKLNITKKDKNKAEIQPLIDDKEELIAISKAGILDAKIAIAKAEKKRKSLKYELAMIPELTKIQYPDISDNVIEQEMAVAINNSGVDPEMVLVPNFFKSAAALTALNTPNGTATTSSILDAPALADNQYGNLNTSTDSNSNDNVTSNASSLSESSTEGSSQSSSQDSSTTSEQASNQNSSSESSQEIGYSNPNTDNNSYNYNSDYNAGFFLPVPEGAELPLSASISGGPNVKPNKPSSIEPSELPQNNDYAGKFTAELEQANVIEDEIQRETSKAEIMDNWGNKLETDLFYLKQKRRNATSDSKKETLTTEIDELQVQIDEIEDAAFGTYEYLSVKQNGQIVVGATDDPVLNAQLAYQSIGNVNKSGYNKAYNLEFGDVGEIDNDYLRLLKTKDISERWVADIQIEVAELEQIAAADADPHRKMIVEKRISSLTQLKAIKEKEMNQATGLVVQYAVDNPITDLPPPSSGVTKDRAEYLAAQSQQMLLSSVQQSQNASSITDPDEKNRAVEQANLDYDQSLFLAKQANDIYAALGRYSTSKSNTIAFNSESEFNNADLGSLGSSSKSNGTNNPSSAVSSAINNSASVNDFRVNQQLFTGETYAQNNADFMVEQANQEVILIEASINTIKSAAESESDPVKKAEMLQGLAQLNQQKTFAEADVEFAKKKSRTIKDAEINAVGNPEANETLIQGLIEDAKKLKQMGEDSLAYSVKLKSDAESADTTENKRLYREAAMVETRANKNLELSKQVVSLASDVKRVEKIAEVKSELPSTLSNFNFPTSDRTLTEAEVKQVTSTQEFEKFTTLKGDYERVMREAETLYKQANSTREKGQLDIGDALELKQQASATKELEERKRLLTQAEDLNKSGKEKLKEAEKMEGAAIDLSDAGMTKKKELEDFVASLDPALASLVIAYNNKQLASPVSSSGQIAQNTNKQNSNNQADNNTNLNEGESENTGNAISQGSSKNGNITPNPSAFRTVASAKEIDLSYDPNTKSIFKIGDENTAYYNEAQPIQFDPELPSGLVYKVQIGAFNKRIPPGNFRGFAPITAENAGGGLLRYTAGLFEQFGTADVAKNEIRKLGYQDAFVVAYYNGKRIQTSDARELQNFVGAPTANLSGGLPKPSSAETSNSNTGTTTGLAASSIENLPPTPSKRTSVSDIQTNSKSADYTDLSKLEGSYYTVQIGVYRKIVEPKDLNNISPIAIFKTASGFYRYNSGVFDNINEAITAKNKIVANGVQDAFVTAYENKNRVNPDNLTAQSAPVNKPTNTPKTVQEKPADKTVTQPTKPQVRPTEKPIPNAVAPTNPVSRPTLDAIVYRIQVGAYEKDIPVKEAKVILGLTKFGVDIVENTAGLTKYLVGTYKNYREADEFKNAMIKLGLNDAFIIALQGGQRIDVEKARNQ